MYLYQSTLSKCIAQAQAESKAQVHVRKKAVNIRFHIIDGAESLQYEINVSKVAVQTRFHMNLAREQSRSSK